MNNVNLVKMKVEGSSKSHSRADIISRDVESVIDEPEVRGGTNLGLTPTETLLASLIGCSNVITHRIAEKKGVKIEYLDITANAKFDKSGASIIEEIEVEEEFEDIDVPFAVIEDVPIFPGCESVAKSQRRACFQEQMNKHIRRNFRYPEIAQEMGIQGRVYVNFIIAKDGSITNIRMRGPDKNLENEAQRIISRLPQMTPGKQRGRPVRVPFSIPITFRLQ